MSKILLDTGPSPAGAHRIEQIARCPQLWAYHHHPALKVLGQPAQAGNRMPLVRGSLLHVGLGHHYARLRAAQNGADVDEYYTPEAAVALVSEKPDMQPLGPQLLPLVLAALDAYRVNYVREDQKLRVLEVEEIREAQIREKYRFTQRFDLVVEDSAGRVWIYDHKGVMRIDARTSTRYTLSVQFIAMQALGRAFYGERFGGVKLNLVGMNEPFTFRRPALDPAPNMLSRFAQMIVDAEERIAGCADRDPWNYPKAASEQVCLTAYGRCDAYELCQWGEVANGL